MKGTSSARKKTRESSARKSSKKSRALRHLIKKEPVRRATTNVVARSETGLQVPGPAHSASLSLSLRDHAFSFQADSISGETTIGDLIVAFPRTRDVLMKHGLRFDVEDAGYLYMTLNVFSAIHGLTSHTLIQELHAMAREPVLSPVQTVRSIPTVPTP